MGKKLVWEAPYNAFTINNSNPLRSFADSTTYRAASYPLFLLILSTGSMAAIIIPLLTVGETKTHRMSDLLKVTQLVGRW